MTDYANDDVDTLRAIAKYCGGTEYGIFLDGLADRMEDVIADVVQPVFTREDVVNLRETAGFYTTMFPDEVALRNTWADELADRLEQTLPTEALPIVRASE